MAFVRTRELKFISRRWLASAIIVAATFTWGCSSSVEVVDDWPTDNSSPYETAWYAPASISITSAPVAYGSPKDDSPAVRSGYTDPGWERAGDAVFPAVNNSVLEIPRVLVPGFTDAIVFPERGSPPAE